MLTRCALGAHSVQRYALLVQPAELGLGWVGLGWQVHDPAHVFTIHFEDYGDEVTTTAVLSELLSELLVRSC